MKKNNVPLLRFDGFSGDWERVKLSDNANFAKGNGYSKADLVDLGTPIILYGRLYTNYQTAINEIDTFADIRKNAVLSKGGEVIVPASGETAEDIARASVVVDSGVILGGDLNIVTADKAIAPEFLALSLSNGTPHKELSKRAQGKSVVHIRNSDLREVILHLPELDEQSAIAELFQNIDDTIDLKRQEHEKTLNIKKAMLDKMFPKGGADAPEIRFTGFTKPWVRRKLDEICDLYSGLTYSPADVTESDGTFVLRSSNVKGGEIVDADNVYVNSTAVNCINVAVGDVIVVVRNGSRNLIGKHGQIKRPMPNTVIGAFMSGLRPIQPEFTNALLDTSHFDFEIAQNLGATINQITNGMFKQMVFSVPTDDDEQSKIGNFFCNLDTLLKAQHEELEKLQSIKKACLSKMFV